jgi:hypothetical protein
LLPASLGAPRRYSLAAVLAAAATVALLPAELLFGTQSVTTPVAATRTLKGWMQERENGLGHEFTVAAMDALPPVEAQRVSLLSIDGNRDGRLVLFPHRHHIEKLGQQESCGKCHHQNMPFDTNSSCCQCHRDMYAMTDTFDHALHVDKLGGNAGCVDCHRDDREVKSRETALACAECHADMIIADSLIAPPDEGLQGFAAGYMDAMHGLCITCHEQTLAENPEQFDPAFAECANCHRDIDGSRFRQMKPYVVRR